MIVVLAAVGSGVGALARYGLAGAVQRRTGGTRPWGTAAVNVTGAVLLGLLTGLHASGQIEADAFTIAGAGFFGGFTTFSTWMLDVVRAAETGGAGRRVAIADLVGQLAAGLAAALLVLAR